MPSISEILANEDFGQVVSTLCVDTIEYREPREYYREYHGERRRRKTSVGWREPKRLAVYSETLKDKNGEPLRLEDKIVDVARIVTNFPKERWFPRVQTCMGTPIENAIRLEVVRP